MPNRHKGKDYWLSLWETPTDFVEVKEESEFGYTMFEQTNDIRKLILLLEEYHHDRQVKSSLVDLIEPWFSESYISKYREEVKAAFDHFMFMLHSNIHLNKTFTVIDKIELILACIKQKLDSKRKYHVVIDNSPGLRSIKPNQLLIKNWDQEKKTFDYRTLDKNNPDIMHKGTLTLNTTKKETWVGDLLGYEAHIFYLTSQAGHTDGSWVEVNDDLSDILELVKTKTGVDYASIDYNKCLEPFTTSFQSKGVVKQETSFLELSASYDHSLWALRLSPLAVPVDDNLSVLLKENILPPLIPNKLYVRADENKFSEAGFVFVHKKGFDDRCHVYYRATDKHQWLSFDIQDLDLFFDAFPLLASNEQGCSEYDIFLDYEKINKLLSLIVPSAEWDNSLFFRNHKDDEYIFYKNDRPDDDFTAFDTIITLMRTLNPDHQHEYVGLNNIWSVKSRIQAALARQVETNNRLEALMKKGLRYSPMKQMAYDKQELDDNRYVFALAQWCLQMHKDGNLFIDLDDVIQLLQSVSIRSPHFVKANDALHSIVCNLPTFPSETKLLFSFLGSNPSAFDQLGQGLSLEELENIRYRLLGTLASTLVEEKRRTYLPYEYNKLRLADKLLELIQVKNQQKTTSQPKTSAESDEKRVSVTGYGSLYCSQTNRSHDSDSESDSEALSQTNNGFDTTDLHL